MQSHKYAAYANAAPYFNLVRRALGDLVDGKHFFDVVEEDIVYEVRYEIAGWPRIIRGRADLMTQFSGYCENVKLQAADRLVSHKADGAHTIVVEYEVHGTILATGARYDNRFCSIIGIERRKIVRWGDYMDSLAAWNALTARPR
jgi:ketosteroid isomerase-like protein